MKNHVRFLRNLTGNLRLTRLLIQPSCKPLLQRALCSSRRGPGAHRSRSGGREQGQRRLDRTIRERRSGGGGSRPATSTALTELAEQAEQAERSTAFSHLSSAVGTTRLLRTPSQTCASHSVADDVREYAERQYRFDSAIDVEWRKREPVVFCREWVADESLHGCSRAIRRLHDEWRLLRAVRSIRARAVRSVRARVIFF